MAVALVGMKTVFAGCLGFFHRAPVCELRQAPAKIKPTSPSPHNHFVLPSVSEDLVIEADFQIVLMDALRDCYIDFSRPREIL